MNELSNRLREAVDYLKKNGYARTDGEIAGKVGTIKSTFSMCLNGSRTPTWDMLLKFCDNYPINFWWLRSGEGSMLKGDLEIDLVRRIKELERKLELLKDRARDA